jgi:hypothetical protein
MMGHWRTATAMPLWQARLHTGMKSPHFRG